MSTRQDTRTTAPDQPNDRRRRTPVFAAVLLALALVGAACGSSSHSSSTPTTAGSSGTQAASTPSGLAAAEAFVNQYTQRPTKITVTQPVGKPVPKGKTMAFIPCGPGPECQQEGQIVQQAGNLLGWTTKIIPNNGSPQGSKAAFQQAINDGVNAILYTAIDESVFASLVPQLQAKGIVLSTCCNLYPAGTDQVIYDVDIPAQTGPVAGGEAALVADLSKCQNADSVIVNIPDLTILNTGVADYKQAMAKYCPSASINQLNIALANISTAPSTIVSFLRAHTSAKYVVLATDALSVGVPAALKAAGLNDVKVVGQGATPTNIQYLHAGEEAADVAFPYDEVMYGMVDAVARHYAGVPVLPSVAPPLWLLTPQNAPQTSAIFPVVPDFQAQYKALWGVS